jgi:osmotically-inducible protein OsmY
VVRPPSAHKRADDEIAERAHKILNWDVEVPDTQLQVKVEKGVVTLTGFVTHQFLKWAAENDIRRLSGVVAILNMIDVRAGAGEAAHSASLPDKIEDALQRSAELEASHITVKVSGRKVILEGKVKSWWERGIAENAAWSAPGITDVANQLVIGG